MLRRTLLALLLLLLVAPAVRAESAAPGEEGGRSFCQQTVSFHLANPVGVPEPYRRFLGIWSDGAWDARSCAALIVENVRPSGIASIIYIYGPMGPDQPGPGGVLHGTGVIRGGALRFNDVKGEEFSFRPGIVDLVGERTTRQGNRSQSVFKQSF
jgi:hypothetical protein